MSKIKNYPFMNPKGIQVIKSKIPLATEYAFDFETQQFKKKDGKMYLVEKNEAIKIWLWKLFMTTTRYNIFPNFYKNDLETLVGKGYTSGFINSEAKRMFTDAINRNLKDYVSEIEKLEVGFDDGTLLISSKIRTIYGSTSLNNRFTWR